MALKNAAKILLLEDDMLLSDMLFCAISEAGYEVLLCENAQEALESAYEKSFDLWILDVRVPLGNGFEVLKELRAANKNTPAIFLTSLSSIEDLKEGYLVGCDDYIKKPFDIDELLLRIKTLLKRKFFHHSEDYLVLDRCENLRFNLLTKTLYKDTEPIYLTTKERDLLELLLQNRGQYLSQESIFEKLWDYGEEPNVEALRTYIKNLRKVLGKESISTQRNLGYCYCKEVL